MLVSPRVGGGPGGTLTLIDIEDILFFFTPTAAIGTKPRIFANWATSNVIDEPNKIYCRTPHLVATVPFPSIDQVVREFPRLALAVAANGVAVNLDRIDEIDASGRFGILLFYIRDSRGQRVATETIRMSKKLGPGVFDTFG
jgi:hypothetical protein